ncbi:hypothetical protein BDR22DRAFT_821460 [Usnea florida]
MSHRTRYKMGYQTGPPSRILIPTLPAFGLVPLCNSDEPDSKSSTLSDEEKPFPSTTDIGGSTASSSKVIIGTPRVQKSNRPNSKSSTLSDEKDPSHPLRMSEEQQRGVVK